MEPLVSILCIAYNHGKYICQCLNGIMNQKTDFPFEIIVHDDASTDDTPAIIQEFEHKYPQLFHCIYQRENQVKLKKPIVRNLLPLIRGKYVAVCEGDDYWIHPQKLQMQIEMLEKEDSSFFATGRSEVIDEAGNSRNYFFPDMEISTGVYSSAEFLKLCLFQRFQYSSFVIRADKYREYILDPPEFRKKARVGDVSILLYFSYLGSVCYVSEVVSRYRLGSVNSWTSRFSLMNSEEKAAVRRNSIGVYEAFDAYSGFRFHDIVAKKILSEDFSIARYEMNFAQINSNKYRENFSALNFKWRFIYRLGTICPWLVRFLLGK